MKSMKSNFSLELDTVYVWHAWLPDFQNYLAELSYLLSPDEMARANRFRFSIHRERFIVARGLLRQLLSKYMSIAPEKIVLTYGARGKPYLQLNLLDLQFNVSHSHDLAVFAFTKKYEVGIDVEKMEKEYNDGIAKRFFSAAEYENLSALPETDRKAAFYEIWTAKEALVKALGEGLYIGLNEFTVTAAAQQRVEFNDHRFYLERVFVHEDYKSVIATEQVGPKVIVTAMV